MFFLSQKKKNTRDLAPSILVVSSVQDSQSPQGRWFRRLVPQHVRGRGLFQQTPRLGFQRPQTFDGVLSLQPCHERRNPWRG